jgi:hypothetical protein
VDTTQLDCSLLFWSLASAMPKRIGVLIFISFCGYANQRVQPSRCAAAVCGSRLWLDVDAGASNRRRRRITKAVEKSEGGMSMYEKQLMGKLAKASPPIHGCLGAHAIRNQIIVPGHCCL